MIKCRGAGGVQVQVEYLIMGPRASEVCGMLGGIRMDEVF